MTEMHGVKPFGCEKTFFLPWKISQKQMSAEEYNSHKEKMNITLSPKVAIEMVAERKKKILYHLPNGAYVVKK